MCDEYPDPGGANFCSTYREGGGNALFIETAASATHCRDSGGGNAL